MGCTPSKSAVIYTQDRVSRDLDTCSTFVPLKSSVSTPEGPRGGADSCGGRQAFLSVPGRDPASHSWSQSSSCGESWSSPGSLSRSDQLSLMPCSPTPDLQGDESFGTA